MLILDMVMTNVHVWTLLFRIPGTRNRSIDSRFRSSRYSISRDNRVNVIGEGDEGKVIRRNRVCLQSVCSAASTMVVTSINDTAQIVSDNDEENLKTSTS